MLKFFTLGPSEIDVNRFRSVENSSSTIKPLGGLWATVFYPEYPKYNAWVDYLTSNVHLLFYKYPSDNPFVKKGLLLNLNDETNIFYLKTYQDFLFLQAKYPCENGFFDYGSISKDFDGIYVDLSSIFGDRNFSEAQKKEFNSFGVSSLILFNCNSIISYQKITLELEPFDYEFPEGFIDYTITVDSNVNELSKSRSLKKINQG